MPLPVGHVLHQPKKSLRERCEEITEASILVVAIMPLENLYFTVVHCLLKWFDKLFILSLFYLYLLVVHCLQTL